MTAVILRRVALLAILCFVTARGQNVTCSDGSNPQGRVTVTGQGSVTNTPDLATVDLRVEVTNTTAAAARESGAKAANSTLTAISAAGIPASDVTTTGLSLFPKTEFNPTTGTSNQTGITFSQNIQVKVINATSDSLAALVDGVIAAGGDALQVSGVSLSLSPEKSKVASNAARALAVSDGLSTAAVLAQAAGTTLGPVTVISDQTFSPPVPMAAAGAPEMAADAAAQKTPTQFVIGDSETQATVGLELALCKAAVGV